MIGFYRKFLKAVFLGKDDDAIQEKTRRDHAVTAQASSVKLQHKHMGRGNTVETSLHLALELRFYLPSTCHREYMKDSKQLPGQRTQHKAGENPPLLPLPSWSPSFHCCRHKEGCWEQSTPPPRAQVAEWSQLSDVALAPLWLRRSVSASELE